MFLLYDLLLILALPLLLPLAALRGWADGNFWEGIGERLGRYRGERLERLRGRPVLWVHAVSVGETRASIPLLRELRRTWPEAAIVLSGVTFTGRRIAATLPEVDLCIFLPYDLPGLVRRALRQIDPAAVLLVETELWPNFLRELGRRETPVLLVNGRISDRSYPRYRRVRGLLRRLLANITCFGMQTAVDAERIVALGAPPERVVVTGNLKFDLVVPRRSAEELAALRRELHLPEGVPLLVAGSTRDGEEEILAEAARRLVEAGLPLLLMLVPRHPERARGVGEQLARLGRRVLFRSDRRAGLTELAPGEVLIGDTLGELLLFYALADLAFVGGSLVPVGGHNPLEPALLGKPVIFGPHMQNARDAAALLLAGGAAAQVGDAADLSALLRDLLHNPGRCRAMGEQGRALCAGHAGATLRTVAQLRELIG